MFNSRVEEEERLFRDWDAMVSNPTAAAQLLQELQPPVQQVISHCRINYRQLVSADQPGLVLDIAPLSDNELAFYCLVCLTRGLKKKNACFVTGMQW
nr:hypothetical protein A3219_20730 [Salmonella enterica]